MKKRLVMVLAVVSANAFGQSAVSKLTADAKADWEMIKATLVRTAEKMPEANYSFKPTAEVRTFGELVAHAADVELMLCPTVSGSGAKPQQGKKTKADLVAYLKAAHADCDKAFAALTDANATEAVKLPWMQRTKFGILSFNNQHANETYGTMVPYLRLKGVVPPSSEK